MKQRLSLHIPCCKRTKGQSPDNGAKHRTEINCEISSSCPHIKSFGPEHSQGGNENV